MYAIFELLSKYHKKLHTNAIHGHYQSCDRNIRWTCHLKRLCDAFNSATGSWEGKYFQAHVDAHYGKTVQFVGHPPGPLQGICFA